MARVNLKDVDAGKPARIKKDKVPSKAEAKAALIKTLEAMPEVERVIDMAPVPYSDQGSEWDDGAQYTEPESDTRHVVRDLTGGKGVSGQTDLTDESRLLLSQMRVYANAYPGIGIETFVEWFELYGLSVGRGSRKEMADILRGNLPLKPEESRKPF